MQGVCIEYQLLLSFTDVVKVLSSVVLDGIKTAPCMPVTLSTDARSGSEQ